MSDLTPREAAYTPQEAQNELVQLLVKGARRCAYDLRHAADDARDNSELWRQRAEMWIGIFDPGDGLKDYRHRLHQVISDQESTIEGLRNLCRINAIEMGRFGEPPF